MEQVGNYVNTAETQIQYKKDKVINLQRYAGKHSFYIKVFKRIFDAVVSFLTLIVLSPTLLIVSAAVKFSSKGPVVFKQSRLGFGGKSFTIYKFRSMKTDAEKAGPTWANEEDERVTKIGGFLRKYHIDELPQLFNIIKGDMSFIGPRPERGYFYDKFEEYIPDFRTRLLVKPGLTGLAQINGGYEIGPEEKLKYDKEYIQKISFVTDMRILFKTVIVVLKGENAR